MFLLKICVQANYYIYIKLVLQSDWQLLFIACYIVLVIYNNI